jgi:membrane protease YdiL (CAAX protease family)
MTTGTSGMNSVRDWLHRALWEVVPRDHRETPAALRRRQVVTAAFVVLGGIVLGISLRIEPGSAWFYAGTLGLAAVWTIGAFLSGPLHLGRIAHTGVRAGPSSRRSCSGSASPGSSCGRLAVRSIPFLDEQVRSVLDHAAEGSLPLLVVITAVNGIAEELFFRGAAYAAVTRYPCR